MHNPEEVERCGILHALWDVVVDYAADQPKFNQRAEESCKGILQQLMMHKDFSISQQYAPIILGSIMDRWFFECEHAWWDTPIFGFLIELRF